MSSFADTKTVAIMKGGLRSIASSIPIAGSFAQAWNEYESHTKNQRLDDFLLDLREIIETMQSDLIKVKHDIETSGQFPALLERTVEKVQKEFSVRKRRMFAIALVKNVAAAGTRAYDDKINIINMLDDLGEADLDVLSKVSDASTAVSAIVNLSTEADEDHRVLASIVVSLSKLESRGLIARYQDDGDNVLPFIDYHWTTKWPERRFQLLPFGRILLESVKEQPIVSDISIKAESAN